MNKKLMMTTLLLSILFAACTPMEVIDTASEYLFPLDEPAQPEAVEITPTIIKQVPPAEQEPTESDSVGEVTLAEEMIFVESDQPPYDIQIVTPYLEGETEVVSPFNFEIAYLVEVIQEVFISDVEEREAQRGEDAMPAVSTLEITYEMTYANDDLFSVHLPITTYLAISAHPSTNSFSYNYDARQRVFLMPGDLFLPEVEFPAVILPAVEEALSTGDFGYQPGTAEDILRIRDNWNILPEGLRINFDAYEVGPGAAGPQFVWIPWAEIAEYLDPEGPARKFIEDG